MGRLTNSSTAYSFIPGKTFTLGYVWDAASNPISMDDPQGGSTTYTYDTLNRLSTLKNPQRNQFAFAYDALGRRTQLSRPNSINTNYQYDSLSRLNSLLHQFTTNKGATTSLDGAAYSYDSAGNRLSRTDSRTNVVSNYSYDSVYELTSVTQGGNTVESYGFDLVGNRLSSLGVASYTYNASNQLTSQPGATYTYDGNGNLASKTDASGTTAYSWDFENRLTRVTQPGGSQVNFKYDPMGRRIQKSSSSGTVNYVYDSANILEEVDTAGNLVTRYTQGLGVDEPLATLRSGATSYYETDGLGSATSLSNSSGALASTYTYDSFGRLLASSGTMSNPYRFTGREFDSETGLYYYRARYYDSATGKFISEDPKRFRAGVNFYSYVRNSPTNFPDPSGMDIAVIENGPTGLLSNPAGHTAIAITGEGTYSFGNGWFEGKSLEDYLLREADKRNTTVYIIHTTAAQDAAALAYLNTQIGKALGGVLKDNCSIRSNKALDAAGIGRPHHILRIPDVLPGSAGARASATGADVIPIRKGSTTIPGGLKQFEPLPYPY